MRNLLKLKAFAGKNWQLIALSVSVLLLIFSYTGCGDKKADNKDIAAELQEYKSLYEACDTAQIELTRINAEQKSKLKNISIPVPELVSNEGESKRLREQIKRNKLKQVNLIGDCKLDSMALAEAITVLDAELDSIYAIAQEKNDSIGILIDQLSEARKSRSYQDSVKEETYTARYSIKTNGTLSDFKLAVDANPVVITRTIKTPAPPAQEYRYKNSVRLLYTPSSSWDTKYSISQKAGIEYQRDAGMVGLRVNGNYLIDTEDYEVSASVYLRPFRWGKKMK